MATLPEPVQFDRVMANLRRKLSDIEKYIKLTGLQRRNESLFCRTLVGYSATPKSRCRRSIRPLSAINGLVWKLALIPVW